MKRIIQIIAFVSIILSYSYSHETHETHETHDEVVHDKELLPVNLSL